MRITLLSDVGSGKIPIIGRAFKHRFLRFVRVHRRLFIPLLIVLVAKLVSSVFLYSFMNMGSTDSYWMAVNWDTEGQNAIIKSVASQGMRWPYVFLGWDSAWYLAIVTKGYAFSYLSYAFFPGFPLSTWLLNFIVQNAAFTQVVFSFILGIAWIPIYQLIAENHMDKSSAGKSALFYAFFPYVFLFTSVVYAEGLFLFSTLAAWYFFEKKKMLLTVLFASLATISRAPGFIVVVPILIGLIQLRRNVESHLPRKDFLYLLAPSVCLSLWYLNLFIRGWLQPSSVTGWEGLSSFRALVLNVFPQEGAQGLLAYFQDYPFSVAFILFLVITPFLIFALSKVDKALTVYSTAYFVGVLFFGGLASIPRFVSFIFPLWFPLTMKLFGTKHSKILTVVIIAVFWLVGLFLWFSFLDGEFIS